MENLHALIDSYLIDDHFAHVDWSPHGLLLSNDSFRFSDEEEEAQVQFSDDINTENKIPFLQMLQRVEPNIIQSLLQIQTLEPECCRTLVTTIPDHYKPLKLGPLSSSPSPTPSLAVPLANESDKERRKRKRTVTPKNKEGVESQRMTHIAVERNRRRQMNEHLNSLKRLMPQSYLQRGDQASIIGGAIGFIKELEQLIHSLEADKRVRAGDVGNEEKQKTVPCRACNSSSVSSASTWDDEVSAGRSAAEIEATVIQNHVSLKVRCKRRQGQILRAILSLEELKFSILHLNITSSLDFVFYSFNLKMEDGCRLGSADEIIAAVHQIFKRINDGG